MSGMSPWLRRALVAVVAVPLLAVGIWVERRYGVPVKIALVIVAFAIALVLAPYEVWKRSRRRGPEPEGR